MHRFEHVVVSEEELRQIVGTPAPRAVLKERPALDEHCRALSGSLPSFLWLQRGRRTLRCLTQGDVPGFVQVVD